MFYYPNRGTTDGRFIIINYTQVKNIGIIYITAQGLGASGSEGLKPEHYSILFYSILLYSSQTYFCLDLALMPTRLTSTALIIILSFAEK
jgi:hypothetical protein